MKLENIVKGIAAATVAVGLAVSFPTYAKKPVLKRNSKTHQRYKPGSCMEAIWEEVHPYVVRGCEVIRSKNKKCVQQVESKCIDYLDGGNPKIAQHTYSVCLGKELSRKSKRAQITIQAKDVSKSRACR